MPDISLNHLAVVVENLDDALGFWCGALGLERAGTTQSITGEGVDVAFLNLGDSRLELIQPTADDSGVARYLAGRGPACTISAWKCRISTICCKPCVIAASN